MAKHRKQKGVSAAGEGWYVLKDAGAVVQITGEKYTDNLHGSGMAKAAATNGIHVAKWGKNNQRPQEILRLVSENHIKPQLIYTARDFVLGNRLGLFRRKSEGGKVVFEPADNPEIEDWAEEVEAEKFMRSAAYNFEMFHNYFAGISLSSKKKVESLTSWDCTETRAELILNRQRRIENYFLHPTWRDWKAAEVSKVPAFDRRDIYRHHEFMFHGRDWLPGQPYYDVPPYWGTEEWTEVSNLIPKFHKNGLKNGYNIKYHIKIPLDYFAQFKDEKKKKEEERRLAESMNAMLAGVDNPDKTFVSKYGTDMNGKPLPGWVIEPLANPMSDDAYSKVNDQANVAQASGHGIDASLASIDTGGKLGGSGSEKRISAQIHIAHRTPTKRKILLEVLNICNRINGFDKNIVWGIEDTQITTLDENPTGTQKAKVNQ